METIERGRILFLSASGIGGRFSIEGYDREFIIKMTHQNYNALFSIATAAAINRYEVRVRAGDAYIENPDAPHDEQYSVHDVKEISVFWPHE